jgi:hypothetical protein
MMVDIKSKFFLSVMLFGSFVNLCASSANNGDQYTVNGVVVYRQVSDDERSRIIEQARSNNPGRIMMYLSYSRLGEAGGRYFVAPYFTDLGVDLIGLERVRFDGETYYRERAASANGNDVKPSSCSVM